MLYRIFIGFPSRLLAHLLEEFFEWITFFLSLLPGRIGTLLRRIFLKLTCERVGKKLGIEPLVQIGGHRTITLGSGVTVGRLSSLHATSGKLVLGNRVALNSNVCLNADLGEIRLGDNVIIGMNTTLRASNHRFDQPGLAIRDQGHQGAPIEVEEDVWIGANCCIVAGVRIGAHSVIGAGSVVVKNIPPYSVAVGSPAKVIRTLDHAP